MAHTAAWVDRLRDIPDLEVRFHESLSSHTSFGIGGPAEILALPYGLAPLQQLLGWACASRTPYYVLGRGTNVLIDDAGLSGLVIKLAGALAGWHVEADRLVAAAGESLAAVCAAAADHGLSGLEFASGIPGTVGGAALMNAGAFEGEMSHIVEWVEVLQSTGELHRMDRARLDFGYRSSNLREHLVVRVGFRLDPCDPADIHSRCCGILEKRCSRQPVASRSAGCVFKRPTGDFAGRLVQAIGAKGLRVGGAAISPKHANFIVNLGGATAQDVRHLIDLVRRKVLEEHGVDLETEICMLGSSSG